MRSDVLAGEIDVITFIFLAAGAIVAGFLIMLAYGASQRKREGQSGKAEANKQQDVATPRATGLD